VKAIFLAPIRLYQRILSPVMPARCKYHPTCSEYAAQAIRMHGVMRGLVLAGWRILRCNPLSNGGIDPVENQRLFKPKARPVAH
jgi:putative membrane protein insertion efficiency factor